MSKTVIIGGGISGLSTAYYLQEFAKDTVDYSILESSSRLGGKIKSDMGDGFLVEGGPDSFLAQKRAAINLCEAVGLGEQMIGSNSDIKPSTYVLHKGKLHPMPEGMMLMAPTMILPFLRSRLISWTGKIRMGLEVLVPRKTSDTDESLAGFVRRRLGSEALEKIAGPLMGGIHAADPEKLSIQSTFPMFIDMERDHRSLLLGMFKRKKNAPHAPAGSKRFSMFMTLRGGLGQLVDAIANRLRPHSIEVNCRVASVASEGDRYRVTLVGGYSTLADDVVFATPAYVTARLLYPVDERLAIMLDSIRYVSTATVSLGFRASDLKTPLNGYGFIVPATEKRAISACSWSSTKFSNRAPEDHVLIRVFIGGALTEDSADRSEEELIAVARRELKEIMGIDATPVLAKAYRWQKANPQYEIGHRDLVTEIDAVAAGHPGLHLVGAAYLGSGIPDCIQSGMTAALEITRRRANALRELHALDLAVPVTN